MLVASLAASPPRYLAGFTKPADDIITEMVRITLTLQDSSMREASAGVLTVIMMKVVTEMTGEKSQNVGNMSRVEIVRVP